MPGRRSHEVSVGATTICYEGVFPEYLAQSFANDGADV